MVLFTLLCMRFIKCPRCHTKHIWLFQHSVVRRIIYGRELSEVLGVIAHTCSCQFVMVSRIHIVSVPVPCSIKVETIYMM
jgi:hypothetical protein